MNTDVNLPESEKEEMRVLLIDDSPSLLDQAKLFLEKEDERLKVETTTSAEEGLKLLEEEDFDAAIADYQMPGMDGLELLEKLRGKNDDIPFIILTGKGSEEVAMEALNQGADRYFKKSGDPKARFKLLAQEAIQEIMQKRLEKKWIESQKELSKERTLLESLLNNLPISIYFKNKDGQHIRASQHLVDSLEPEQAESKSDVIGKTDFDLYPDELAEKTAEDDKRVMETRDPIINREEHSHAPDGSDIYHLTTKAPLVDEEDNVIGVMGFSQDITERKKAQEKLAREKNLLEGILKNFPASIYVKDREGKHVRVSERLREDLQENGHEEIIGKTDLDLYPEKGERTYEEDMRVMEGEEPLIDKEYSIEDSEGNERYFSTSKAPVYDDENEVIGLVGITQEITERKKLRKRLNFESNLLNDLLKNVPDLIYFKDEEGRFVEVSESKAEEVGAESRKDLYGKTDFDYYPEERAKENYEDDLHVMKTEEAIINREEKYETPDGTERWLGATKVPRYGEDGNVIGILGISRDITDRKRAENRAQKRANLLQTLMNNSPDQIYFKDEEHKFIMLNEPTAELLGASVEEAIGKTDFDFFPDDAAEEYWEEEEKIMGTREPIVDRIDETEQEEGEKRWNSMTKVPLIDENGDVAGIAGISRDITERKKAEQKITFQSNLLQSLLKLIPDSIYFKDKEGRFVEISESKAEELGMDREEIIGKTDFDFYPEEEAREMFEDDKRVMEEEEPVINKEERIVTPTGEEWWASVTKVPRYDEDGNVIGTLGISRDITERKQGEQREEFLHSLLDHDIETKNKTATGILELLKERDITQQGKNMIDTAINSIEDSSGLISRVWTLRKASRKTELSEVELESEIKSAMESNEELLENKEIDTEIEETDGQIMGGRLVENLFSNLIEWIVRFGECSTLRLNTREENGRITTIIEGDGQEVPEMIKRGIRKDFREGQVKEGGMMIYLASTISTAYKGNFEIKNSELGGARFDVSLRKS